MGLVVEMAEETEDMVEGARAAVARVVAARAVVTVAETVVETAVAMVVAMAEEEMAGVMAEEGREVRLVAGMKAETAVEETGARMEVAWVVQGEKMVATVLVVERVAVMSAEDYLAMVEDQVAAMVVVVMVVEMATVGMEARTVVAVAKEERKVEVETVVETTRCTHRRQLWRWS